MPTSINNYAFTDIQYTVPENSLVFPVFPTAQLTIVPNSGYTAVATDFSLDPSFSDPAVQGVTFTQSGLNVLVTATFATSFVMPMANYTINLCIIGDANSAKIDISGTVTASVGANVTGGSSEVDTPYTNDGAFGESELLFSRSYAAATNYYWNPEQALPSANIVTGNQSNYNIIQTPTYNSSNQLTAIQFDFKYIYPNSSVTGDHINISVPRTAVQYLPLPKIASYEMDLSPISNPATVRSLTLFGTPGTSFGVSMTDGTTGTVIVPNTTMPAGGVFSTNVTFPELVKGNPNVTYTISITGSFVSGMAQPNPFTIRQLNEVLLIFGKVSNVPTPISGFPVPNPRTTFNALTNNPNSDALSTGAFRVGVNSNITPFNGTGTFAVIKQVELSDFTNTELIIGLPSSAQTATTTLALVDTTGILVGDEITTQFGGSPGIILSTVASVDSATQLTVSTAMTVINQQPLLFTRANQNAFTIISSNVTLINPLTVNLNFSIAITRFGESGKTFDLDLSNIISYTP